MARAGAFWEDSAALAAWLESLSQQWKNEWAVKVIRLLEELLEELEEGSSELETVVQEVAYLREHEPRVGYRSAHRRQEPLGRGAVGASCVPDPCGFPAGP